jgi:trans-aconitate methyltransferase
MRYTYGTSDIAANRLEEIARFFNPLSIQFIRKYVQEPVGSVIDLGCGPGFTTSMLAQALKYDKVYGLDSASHFLKMAREKFKQFTFIEHDVTKTPFPVRADVMYSRFLLSHLRDVVSLINRWTGELLDSGILIIEELEDIDSEVPVFQKYIKSTELFT